MFFDLRWLVVLGVNIFAMFCFQLLNDLISPGSMHLFLAGALLVIPPFYLGIRGSAACALLLGIFWEAAQPSLAGFAVPAFLLINLFVHLNRKRFQREHNTQLIALTLIINSIWIILLAFQFDSGNYFGSAYWGRFLFDFIASQIVACSAVIWLHELHRTCLRLARFSLHSEDYAT